MAAIWTALHSAAYSAFSEQPSKHSLSFCKTLLSPQMSQVVQDLVQAVKTSQLTFEKGRHISTRKGEIGKERWIRLAYCSLWIVIFNILKDYVVVKRKLSIWNISFQPNEMTSIWTSELVIYIYTFLALIFTCETVVMYFADSVFIANLSSFYFSLFILFLYLPKSIFRTPRFRNNLR